MGWRNLPWHGPTLRIRDPAAGPDAAEATAPTRTLEHIEEPIGDGLSTYRYAVTALDADGETVPVNGAWTPAKLADGWTSLPPERQARASEIIMTLPPGYRPAMPQALDILLDPGFDPPDFAWPERWPGEEPVAERSPGRRWRQGRGVMPARRIVQILRNEQVRRG